MEKNETPPINEDYIMSIVSDTDSGQKKIVSEDNDQIRQVTMKINENIVSKENDNPVLEERQTTIKAVSMEEKKENQEYREIKKRKNRQVPIDYESQFIKKADMTVRSGKGVYIRSEFHNNINRIISVVGNNEISITDYLDNILSHHFEFFEQEITDVFDKNYKPLFNKNR